MLNVLFNLLATVFHLGSLPVFIPFLRLLFGKVEAVAGACGLRAEQGGPHRLVQLEDGRLHLQHGQVGALVFICVSVVVLFLLKNLFRWLALGAIGVMRNRRCRTSAMWCTTSAGAAHAVPPGRAQGRHPGADHQRRAGASSSAS